MGIFSSLILIAFLSNLKNFPLIAAIVLSIFLGLNTLAITKNQSFITQKGTYLLHSDTCPHCKKVKNYLAEHDIKYTSISIDEASARSFLKFAGFSTIPVLLIKDTQGIQMFEGDRKIIAYYENLNKTQTSKTASQTSPSKHSSTLGLPNEIFSATSELGCAITITETPECEKNATKK